MFVSSHLMSEMQLTADQLVVIGRGRLIANAPIAAVIAGSSQTTVRVRVPERADRTTLRERLAAEAEQVESVTDQLVVTGVSVERVGDLAHELMSSWWIYLALFGFATLDGFFPAIPSETLVVTAGVFSALGEPNLYGVIAAAATGAFVGDHVSYLLGRGASGRLLARFKQGTKRHAMTLWARNALAERGGLVLVVARYVPGGRTAVTLTMGAVRYPLRSFSFFAGLAALSWGLYCSLVGYLGGNVFEDNPIKGVILGIGLAITVTLIVEVVRHQRRRHRIPEPEVEIEFATEGEPVR